MGCSDSQPQQDTNVRKSEVKEQKEEVRAFPTCIHEKHEELMFDENNQLENEIASLSSSEFFDIATIHPEYCGLIEDIIRLAIRNKSIQESKNQNDYNKNFAFSDRMEKSRLKVLEHFKFRKQIQIFNKDTYNVPIQISYESNPEIKNEPGINFQNIITILRDIWFLNNFKTIENLNASIQILTGSPRNKTLDELKIRSALSNILGKDYSTLIPEQQLKYDEIKKESKKLIKRLQKTQISCCMIFSQTNPINEKIINGKVLKHGICSNGTFLFTLTMERTLSVFLIYQGSVDKLMKEYVLDESWNFNNDTTLFCSQKFLYLVYNKQTFQWPICNTLQNVDICFKKVNNQALENITNACSNGVSYSIINNEQRIKIFNAENERCIFNQKNERAANYCHSSENTEILLTNGYFFGLLKSSGEIKMFSPYLSSSIIFEQNETFPLENDTLIEAATFDSLSNSYFSVSYNKEKSIIYAYPYNGAPDITILKSKESDIQSIGNILLNALYPYAFSPITPDIYTSTSEKYLEDIKNLAMFVDRNIHDTSLVKGLLLLIDINLRKYDCNSLANFLLPILQKAINLAENKMIASAVLVNNIDIFYNNFKLDSFDILNQILNSQNDSNYQIFNEWILKLLSQSSFIGKIPFDENLLQHLFTDSWFCKSRNDKKYKWMVDLLLISQQKIVENVVELLEFDPMNLTKSDSITLLCNHIQFLLEKFHSLLIQIIYEKQKKDRKINYDTILFTLISNIVAITAPVTQCCQFASIITNKNGTAIIKLLSNDFYKDDKLLLFIGYYDMIYTTSIAELIRGGHAYPCEIEYSWLIKNNFYQGLNNLIPEEITMMTEYFSNLNDDFIKSFINNESEEINFLYQKMRTFKPIKNEYYKTDRIIMAAFCHQTNTFNLLFESKEQNKISDELTQIINNVKKIRNCFSREKQKEAVKKTQGIRQSDKYLANLGLLITLKPSFIDFKEKSKSIQIDYLNLIYKFIVNNDPYNFQQILKIVPKRIDHVLNGFERLNYLFQEVKNPAFQRIIIDGISRVDSFERLGYLLSNVELNHHALSELAAFCLICIDMVVDAHQFTILEILYTVLEKCHNFINDLNVMNKLLSLTINKEFKLDSIFMTVAGLAKSTCILPEKFDKISIYGQAYILQLIYGQHDKDTLSIDDIEQFIYFNHKYNFILNEVWITMIFTLIGKCQFDNSEKMSNILEILFQNASTYLEKDDFDFSFLPSIVYGFRYILNLENKVSEIMQLILQSVTIESKNSELLLLFAIMGADIADYSKFCEFRNQQGSWLKYTNNGKDYILSLPFSSINNIHDSIDSEINQTVAKIELNTKIPLSFEAIIEFQKICTNDECSMLCRFYLQTFAKYITNIDQKIPEELLTYLSSSAKPYTDFNKISKYQTYLTEKHIDSFQSIESLLPENNTKFGYIQQSQWTHIFIYNILKFVPNSISVIMINEGYVIIHNEEDILIDITNKTIGDGNDQIDIEDGQFEITINYNESKIKIQNQTFIIDNFSYIEFIIDSIDNIVFYTEDNISIDNDLITNHIKNNIHIEYKNDLFEPNENGMESFADNFYNFKQLKINKTEANISERDGMNTNYNLLMESVSFNENIPFSASYSIYNRIYKQNEFEICSQLKCFALAQIANKFQDNLDWMTSLFVLKSAVVAVAEVNKEKLMNDKFPFSLDDGFLHNCSLRILQNNHYQTFLMAIKAFVKSQTFLDNLGNQLVEMASDRKYHCLIHKKELVIFRSDQIDLYEKQENDYFIDFFDGSIGKLEIDDSGKWMINTPIVFLLLLWIYIEHCTTSKQRVLAKLALVNCWLIKSPMIYKYMPEFLSYLQKQIPFTPDDFNPVYIHHLSSLAKIYKNDKQIMGFYEFERNCHRLKHVKDSIFSKNINLNQFDRIDLNLYKKNMNPSKLIEIIQLMKKYESVDHFPIWYFIPIWREISSYTIKKYSDRKSFIKEKNYTKIFNQIDKPLLFEFTITNTDSCKFNICDNQSLTNKKEISSENHGEKIKSFFVLNPGEQKYLVCNCNKNPTLDIKQYQIEHENQITFENLESDIKKFAIEWLEKDTEELLISDKNLLLQCDNFLWILLETLNMTKLINKYGLKTVQCKVACLFLIDHLKNYYNENKNEMISLGQENSHYLSYYYRINKLDFEKSHIETNNGNLFDIFRGSYDRSIYLNGDSAAKYMSGESKNVNDAMIFQIAKKVQIYPIERFQQSKLNIKFNGKKAIDVGGVTNQTITMSTQSFVMLKSGICIKSPNYTDNNEDNENTDQTDIQVIPYPTKNNKNIRDVLYAFGVILGSIMRTKKNQHIPFPLFVWNYLAGKPITKDDIYENDINLKNEIDGIRDGSISNHRWIYRDWNNNILPINGFAENQIIPPHLVDFYEKLVIDLRIKSIEKHLKIIKEGLYDNQSIIDSSLLSGGLIMFLCQGEQALDRQEVIKRIVFRGGNATLQQNVIKILNEYNENTLKMFLMFVTGCQKLPILALSPDFHITIDFIYLANTQKLPTSHTCFNKLDMPFYQNIDIMRLKLTQAIENCSTLDNS